MSRVVGMVLMVSFVSLHSALHISSRSAGYFSSPCKRLRKLPFFRMMSSGDDKKNQGHLPPSGLEQAVSPADQKLIENFKDQQSKAKRLTFAEEVRGLLDQSIHFGVLSTNSASLDGYPSGSVVGFMLDEQGYPFFSFSTMSGHTTDILKDGKCSLSVLAKNFKGAAEGRVTLTGDVRKVFSRERIQQLRERYKLFHKDAYWVDFGDFAFFEMESIKSIRFVGGFAMAGSITPEEYLAAKVDPLASFAEPVMKHMNDDHSESTVAMVSHYTGIPCSEAAIVSIDRYGMTVCFTYTIARH